MSSIRLLLLEDTVFNYSTPRLDSPLILPGGFKLPDTLKVVQWSSFPLEALPLETRRNELVHLEMSNSRIKKLWNVIQPKMLKFINLNCSKYITETPDFSGVPCLEHLNLNECISLEKVHHSLGELKRLVEVDLGSCGKLKILPRKLIAKSLVRLNLGGCDEVAELPEFGEGMEKLSYLDVSFTAITRLPESFGSLTGLRDLRRCGLNDGSILDGFVSLSSLVILDLSCGDFVNLPTTCFSSLFRLLFLSLADCKKLKSLPRLPPRLIRLNTSYCNSMEPLSSDGQLWNLVASLDHEYRGQTKYVILDDDYYDTPSKFKQAKPEYLPLRDFFASVPGCKIPSWFPNKSVSNWEHVIEVEIPRHLRDSEWSGIVVCLHIPEDFYGLIAWSSKAPEDDDYIWKEWAHRCFIGGGQNGYLCIMVLELNEKTCWQHLKAPDNSLHIKLYAQFDPSLTFGFRAHRISKLKRGWRVICKEEIQKWCNDNDFNQLAQSQLASHDEINLPSSVLYRYEEINPHFADKREFSHYKEE